MEDHSLADVDNHPGAMKAHSVDAVASKGAMKAHLVDIEEWEAYREIEDKASSPILTLIS